MTASVDVWDPTPEGAWLVENLERSDFEVRAVHLDELVGTCADVVLVAGDVAGGLGALKALRDDGLNGDVPVVLLGVPEGTTHPGDGPGFGAEAVFRRPVHYPQLLARLLSLLESAPRGEVSRVQVPVPERTMQLADPDDPNCSQVLERVSEPAAAWRPKEPTLHLAEDPVELGSGAGTSGPRRGSQVQGRDQPQGPPSQPGTTSTGRRRGSSSTGSVSGTGSGTGGGSILDRPPREIAPGRRAVLSPWLAALLHAADRRVFPSLSPLRLHLPAADEPADELVPEELLDLPSFEIDEPVVEDPIDAFTYIGGPAVPLAAGALAPPPVAAAAGGEPAQIIELGPEVPLRRPSSTTASGRRVHTASDARTRSPREVTTATELPPLPPSGQQAVALEWPDDDTVLGRTTAGGDRHGQLGPGGALRLLWRVAALGLDAICELRLVGGPTVRMTFLAGELRAFDGPIARAVLDGLRRRGRATERVADEASAEAVLQKRVDAGQLGRFERDRLMREARERLLVTIVGSEQAEFVLRRLDDTQPGRALSRARMMRRPLRAALAEAAREAFDPARAATLLGAEDPGLALGPRREAALAEAELTSEIVELIVRMDGQRLGTFLRAAPTARGLAGLLYALVAGDALVLTDPAEGAAVDARAAVVELIRVAAAHAVEADYFVVLGVSPDASRGDIEEAHLSRREELIAVPLGALGLDHLERDRDLAVQAIDEALTALRDAPRRRSYARAITAASMG